MDSRTSCLATRADGVLSPIQQAEREDAIADWLADHGVDAAIAGPLAETAVTLDALDRIAAAVSGPRLTPVLRWDGRRMFGSCARLGNSGSGERISGLVTAIKGFTHMDQATVAEPVDLTTEPGQHRRGSQIKSAGEVGRRRDERASRPAARPWLCRRAQPDLVEPDRQRARCRRRSPVASR